MEKNIFRCLFIFLVSLCLFSCSEETISDGTEDVTKEDVVAIEEPEDVVYATELGITSSERQTIASNNDFALTLYAKLDQDAKGNTVISPLSISIAMTMMANGAYAGSPAYTEILNTLGYANLEISEVNSAMKKLADGINRLDEDVDLSLSNSLWVNPSRMKVNPDYEAILKKDFCAESYPIIESSYVSDVNRWCRIKTKGMIEKIIADGTRAPGMAIINATYFKGLWSQGFAFNKDLNQKASFITDGGHSSYVDFMVHFGQYESRKSEDMEMIAIPFGKGNYNFYVIKPNQENSTSKCINSLLGGKWNELIAKSPSKEFLEVKIPKFDIDFSTDIKESLAEMGMQKAMKTPDYYFAYNEGLIIDNVLHKSRLLIDEEGAEGAGVTGIFLDPISNDEPNNSEQIEYRPFHLDHPFIYLITEKESGAIIFIGCVKSL